MSAGEIADSLKGINPRIRKRLTYRFFKELYEWLKTNPPPEEILWRLFKILDDRRVFGSATNAKYARESIELILSEK